MSKRTWPVARTCFQLTDVEPCRLCADPGRDASTILVVEQPGDLMTFEGTGMYRGVYHVLDWSNRSTGRNRSR